MPVKSIATPPRLAAAITSSSRTEPPGCTTAVTPAAVGSFLVAVANNYTLNRLWTFKAHQRSVAYQGPRFLVVSTLALGANLVVLYGLVRAGVGAIPAQAIAIVLVTPLNFVGNKLWSFRR